jgi:hypothetical protein
MSSPVTVLKNEFATVWYHPDGKIVHHQFHKFIYGQAFRDVLTKGAEIFEQHGATKWLSDDRNNSALPAEDSDWGVQVWTPRVLKSGWKYWAVVMPEKVIGQMNMRRFVEMYSEMGVIVKVFSSPDEALAWLRNPEPMTQKEAARP